MSEKTIYYYDDEWLTEDDALALIKDSVRLQIWINAVDLRLLNKISVESYTECLGDIARKALEDFLDYSEGVQADDIGEYFCFAIFDSEKKFLGFGKAYFEYTIDYTGKEMYRHK